MTNEKITRREAAKLLGIHRDTLSRLLNGVLAPAVLGRQGRGGALRISRQAIEVYGAAMREQRPLDPQNERARKDAAHASLAELKLKVERGRYLPVDDVRKAWAAEVAAVRALLLAWSITIADRVHRAATLDGVIGVERELHDAVYEVLTELSADHRVLASRLRAALLELSTDGKLHPLMRAELRELLGTPGPAKKKAKRKKAAKKKTRRKATPAKTAKKKTKRASRSSG